MSKLIGPGSILVVLFKSVYYKGKTHQVEANHHHSIVIYIVVIDIVVVDMVVVEMVVVKMVVVKMVVVDMEVVGHMFRFKIS